jgi:hypothetical protein
MGGHVILTQRMAELCFDPQAAGVVAISAIKDDIHRKPSEMISEYESLLAKTKTLGLRNAIRMGLKDLYRDEKDSEKALQVIRDMVAENDAAIQSGVAAPAKHPPVPAP